MKIGELAQVTRTKAETIRYYEQIGLLPPADRTRGNYRSYGSDDEARLTFIRNARRLGFEVAEVRSLLELADGLAGKGDTTGRIAADHLNIVEAKIMQLQRLRSELRKVISVDPGTAQLVGALAELKPED